MSVRKQGRLSLPSPEYKSLLLFQYSTSAISSDSCVKTLSNAWRWPCRVFVWVLRVWVQMCKRARACDYKGRIWDALGKTNTDSDRCQQHLSDLHFLIAKELPKKHFTSTDRQRGTATGSTWRRKCFHTNICRKLRKLPHKPEASGSLIGCILECQRICTYISNSRSLCTHQYRETQLCAQSLHAKHLQTFASVLKRKYSQNIF